MRFLKLIKGYNIYLEFTWNSTWKNKMVEYATRLGSSPSQVGWKQFQFVNINKQGGE